MHTFGRPRHDDEWSNETVVVIDRTTIPTCWRSQWWMESIVHGAANSVKLRAKLWWSCFSTVAVADGPGISEEKDAVPTRHFLWKSEMLQELASDRRRMVPLDGQQRGWCCCVLLLLVEGFDVMVCRGGSGAKRVRWCVCAGYRE